MTMTPGPATTPIVWQKSLIDSEVWGFLSVDMVLSLL